MNSPSAHEAKPYQYNVSGALTNSGHPLRSGMGIPSSLPPVFEDQNVEIRALCTGLTHFNLLDIPSLDPRHGVN